MNQVIKRPPPDKFTQGGWSVFSNPIGVGVTAPDADVARCDGFNEMRTKEEVEANARLIAAAPELLKKLRWNMSWLRAALDCKAWEWDWDQRSVAEDDYAEGMALIAKATIGEGKTQ